MTHYDQIVRGGAVVSPTGVSLADVAIDDGMIVEINPEIEGSSREEIDARGLHVLPGAVDIHVHFNEPDGLAKALVKTIEYRAATPSKLEELIFYDHPAVGNRVRAAMDWKATHPKAETPPPAS